MYVSCERNGFGTCKKTGKIFIRHLISLPRQIKTYSPGGYGTPRIRSTKAEYPSHRNKDPVAARSTTYAAVANMITTPIEKDRCWERPSHSETDDGGQLVLTDG